MSGGKAGKSLAGWEKEWKQLWLEVPWERRRPGGWDLFMTWWGALGRLSPESGLWLLCGVQITGNGPGKSFRKTCSWGSGENEEGGIRDSFRDNA